MLVRGGLKPVAERLAHEFDPGKLLPEIVMEFAADPLLLLDAAVGDLLFELLALGHVAGVHRKARDRAVRTPVGAESHVQPARPSTRQVEHGFVMQVLARQAAVHPGLDLPFEELLPVQFGNGGPDDFLAASSVKPDVGVVDLPVDIIPSHERQHVVAG